MTDDQTVFEDPVYLTPTAKPVSGTQVRLPGGGMGLLYGDSRRIGKLLGSRFDIDCWIVRRTGGDLMFFPKAEQPWLELLLWDHDHRSEPS